MGSNAIAIGQPIAVTALVLPEHPGQVRADVVIPGVTSVPVDLTGIITRLACAVANLGVQDAATRQDARVTLTAQTQIVCPGDLACGCADLRVRDRVHVVGQRPPEGVR